VCKTTHTKAHKLSVCNGRGVGRAATIKRERRGNQSIPAEIPHGVFWRDAAGQGCGLGSFVCARERRDDARGKNAPVEGDGEAVAVSVQGNSPFEKGAVAGRFDVVGECARVLQDGLKVEE
jgi:hypothetical protein